MLGARADDQLNTQRSVFVHETLSHVPLRVIPDDCVRFLASVALVARSIHYTRLAVVSWSSCRDRGGRTRLAHGPRTAPAVIGIDEEKAKQNRPSLCRWDPTTGSTVQVA